MRGRSRFTILAGITVFMGFAATSSADVEYYRVTFNTPPHAVCEVPAVGSGPATRTTISSIPTGAPRVTPELGPLDDQPLQFDSYDQHDAIELDLFDLPASNSYELSCQLMVALTDGGVLTVLFDTPEIRNINFHPNGKVSILIPSQGENTIATYTLGQVVQLRVNVDLGGDNWRIYLDNVLVHSGTFGGATSLRSVRFGTGFVFGHLVAGLDNLEIRGTPVVGVDDGAPTSATARFWTSPNPFRGNADFQFELPAPGTVEVEIFDLGGRRMATLSRVAPMGPGTLRWDGHGIDGLEVPTGTYLYRASSGGVHMNGRVIKLR